MNYAVSDTVGLKFLVVNGNFDFADVSDLNEVPAFGAQVTLAPSDNVFLAVGYATQAEAGNNDWGHFIDVVATIGLTDSIKLYTYTNRDTGPVIIHQASYPYPVKSVAPAGDFLQGTDSGFTGLNWVYETVRDSELQYWCELKSGTPK